MLQKSSDELYYLLGVMVQNISFIVVDFAEQGSLWWMNTSSGDDRCTFAVNKT